ncbi:MAG: YraN family protein [Lachnospiraceae bacterium]|nr:YraN family protein [Lachnospiraceae bacterium]
MNKRRVGGEKEEWAARYLFSLGYDVLESNFFGRHGEIDIVAKDGQTMVFVEVKFRSYERMGYPQESVDFRKQSRVRAAARQYLYSHGYAPDQPCRFDVIAILGQRMQHIKDAF